MPAVAGQFYSGAASSLSKEVEGLIDRNAREVIDAIGVVSPHAGYIYSGRVAGAVLSSIAPRPHYIIMGPNHTGMGERFSVSGASFWRTPLGDVEIDTELADRIKSDCRYIKEDEAAHLGEHSIEVELPFLQALEKGFKFVPILIGQSDLAVYKEIGRALARSIVGSKLEKKIVIIASSDMTHYEPQEAAKEKDRKAIEAILKLDEDELIGDIEKYDITMCGYAPVAIMLVAAKKLGAKEGRLVKYETSGDASGDYSSVVGYAGLVIN